MCNTDDTSDNSKPVGHDELRPVPQHVCRGSARHVECYFLPGGVPRQSHFIPAYNSGKYNFFVSDALWGICSQVLGSVHCVHDWSLEEEEEGGYLYLIM